MKNRIKKWFEMNNWKRILISLITIVGTFLAITFGSVFFISQNPNKSIEYGGGVEILVQVKKDNQEASQELTTKVSESLTQRLSGGTDLNGTKVSQEGDGKIRITKSGSVSDAQRVELERTITHKPIITMTDINVNPLFDNGVFTENGSLEVGNVESWIPPFEEGSAKYKPENGKNAVAISLKDNSAVLEWTKATDYLSKKPSGQNVVLIWSDLDEILKIAKSDEFRDDWIASGENLYNFMFVNNKPSEVQFDSETNSTKLIQNVYKTAGFNAEKYLISAASVTQPLNSKDIVISGNFTTQEATKLANNINYGLTDYKLDLLSSIYVTPTLNDNAFSSAIWAGVVVFALIAIFMIVNYGLLGALSTISIALYIFLTLLMFSVLRGEYSPSTIAALVIGIGISVDANIITFERLKNEIYSGDSLKKSFKNSNRLSISSIIDANITTIIVAFILFYFGTKSVKGFSISLILSILFTLLVMLVFTRFLSTMIVQTGYFEKRLWLLGVHKKYIAKQNKNVWYKKVNYTKHAKWFAIGSFAIILAGALAFIIIGLSQGSIWSGINRSIEFRGGTNILIRGNQDYNISLDQTYIENVRSYLVQKSSEWGIQNINEVISIQRSDLSIDNWILVLRTTQDLSALTSVIQADVASQLSDVSVISYAVSSKEATTLVVNALMAISISFVGIVLYTLLRMKWTFSIAAIFGLVHDILLVVAFIIITRIQVNSIVVAAMLSIVGFSINYTIVTFDRIREILTQEYNTSSTLDKKQVRAVANKAVAQTFKRSIYTTVTTMMAILVLLAFQNATDFSFNIIVLFGMAIGTYSSIFICSWLWTVLENIRQKRVQKRKNNHYWDVNKPEEQYFVGINDYTV
ncbi:protein translocase subunit SecDF [Mycoplasma sp. Ms02]|uniref:protein translocase subunit SecDF n=1 Tax=Mycoplasma sp. Ms02 TaxID=353851 RepID=UPI001C8A2B9C|nr:protein translocase subunit SecDF [Mycoplasma sp. Ms02]QZE12559.1 protein translocase subunit SecDF [Mycoplasma sp. Ms02]